MNDYGMHLYFIRIVHLEMVFTVIFCPILTEDYNVVLCGGGGGPPTLKQWGADEAPAPMNGL